MVFHTFMLYKLDEYWYGSHKENECDRKAKEAQDLFLTNHSLPIHFNKMVQQKRSR